MLERQRHSPRDGLDATRRAAQQARGYVARPDHFHPEDAEALAADLGRISKFQSVNSEDAVTYSWFGTLAAASPEERRASAQWLFDRVGLLATAAAPVIDQWARVFHPNAPSSSRGPELDARIDDPGAALVYVEAKWNAGIGTGKGRTQGRSDDQVVLRRDSLRADPALRDDRRNFLILGVSEHVSDLSVYDESEPSGQPVAITWLTWDQLAECPMHPQAEEFKRYLHWKRTAAK